LALARDIWSCPLIGSRTPLQSAQTEFDEVRPLPDLPRGARLTIEP
jgi:hypothetical protein